LLFLVLNFFPLNIHRQRADHRKVASSDSGGFSCPSPYDDLAFF
jgi:hypothetical protein